MIANAAVFRGGRMFRRHRYGAQSVIRNFLRAAGRLARRPKAYHVYGSWRAPYVWAPCKAPKGLSIDLLKYAIHYHYNHNRYY